jgi:hypothetical protein
MNQSRYYAPVSPPVAMAMAIACKHRLAKQTCNQAQMHNHIINQSINHLILMTSCLSAKESTTRVFFVNNGSFSHFCTPIFMSFSAIKQAQSKTQREHTENATTTSQSIKFMHRSIHPATLP